MNILQVLPELNVGGVETGTLDMAKYLIRQGHKAVVASAGGELVKELVASGAVHYQLPVNKKSLPVIIKMVNRLADIIEKEKIDIVHARSRVPAWAAYFAARKTRRVFITTCHGYYKRHYFSNVMGWGKRVIVLSNVIARHMIDDFAVPHERIRLIPRSVDLERFKYLRPDTKRKKEFNVGIIGRITPLKGHLYFIKAMAKVARETRNIKIWVVGDAPVSKEGYKEEVRILTRRLGLWNCTEFLGTQRDIPGILSHLDLLVLPTITHEAFGRVIVEAQACGVPVIATEVGGVVDIIENGKNGLLVPPAEPNSLAEAILKIYKDPGLALRLAENALKKVHEQYNVELMASRTLDVYQEALTHFKMLIIKFSSLGDIILSTASLKAIREKFGASHKITFLVGEESKEALLRCPYIDELLVADLKNKDKGWASLWGLAKKLQKENFDLVIDLQNNKKSHLLSYLTLSLDRYGYDNKKLAFLLNHTVREDKQPLDPVTHQSRILKLLDIELKNPSLELWPSQEDCAYIENLLSQEWLSVNQKIIGIHISASPKWLTKSWPIASMARLCEELGKLDLRIVITGTENDLQSAQELLSYIQGVKLINACGKTSINQLACLIEKCAVFVSADSSPLHIASAMNTPFVALFGPTDPARHLPPAKDFVVIRKELDCSPCYKRKCKSRKCMEMIKPQEVLEAIKNLLK